MKYTIEYTFPPMRGIYTQELYGETEEEAIKALLENQPNAKVRKVQEISNKEGPGEKDPYKDLYERMKQEYLEQCKETGRLRKALEKIKEVTGPDYSSGYKGAKKAVEIATQALEPAKGEDERE